MNVNLFNNARHVCFDKDGTLIDVHAYCSYLSELRADLLTRELGLPKSAATDLYEAMGIDSKMNRVKKRGPVGYYPRHAVINAVMNYLSATGVAVTAERIAELFGVVDRKQQENNDYRIELLPGVRECLQLLHRKSLFISAFSSDRRENSLRIFSLLGINEYFSTIVGGGCIVKPKPDPEGFLQACDRLGVTSAASIYVGDTVEDLKMAQAGHAMESVGVCTGLDDFKELAKHSDHVYPDMTAIINI